ncbi:4Fe-4S dicluster domain-containing protein [Sporolituus thermophilus]|uniref:Prokaryotic molybdopterin-containing oxidoreductase family, iron-sulfur binding subunit n=1 Tax=Sporolituus thermophilus DSM 23256 TaxID=1123285 RepID=A0A1G7HR04_9FIRM|nr:4Fe-4S dicluster domain-containing protein [Sporolituus thermophilus]SDF02895.1 prokaryotic molybdopterin-containing oxidoreductase family, iron-sulfur binding subunit [Sporolituus thermophilus DSM 23256]
MEKEDVLLIMQRDLAKALQKPPEKRQWGMLIDTRKCIGCHACTIGCVAEYKLPPGVVYRPVIDLESGKFPNVKRQFLPRPCFQCETPSCVPVCPVKATQKGPDGIVTIDYTKCIGCRSCVAACPYGARTFDAGAYYTDGTPAVQEYEKAVAYEYGKAWRRDAKHAAVVGSARKCHFCTSRLAKGLLPVCVATCIGRATYFGDLTDDQSLIRQVMAANKPYRLKEETGNKPQVYYI